MCVLVGGCYAAVWGARDDVISRGTKRLSLSSAKLKEAPEKNELTGAKVLY